MNDKRFLAVCIMTYEHSDTVKKNTSYLECTGGRAWI
jgi:hypothetical protein